MPQHSTMLRIISKICRREEYAWSVSRLLGGLAPPSTHPRPCAYHDDSYHNGCNTNEIQLPRKELIDFLMAIALQG